MDYRHPVTEPIRSGVLDVGNGHLVHWEMSGIANGKPAVLLHGGPGSGSSPRHRQLFDPTRYCIVQFDQRNTGRSTPYGGDRFVDLTTNTTDHLVADIEQLRAELDIDQWLVWGGSWGTTLALAYAEAHPYAVSELILASVTNTSAAEVDWITRSMQRVFPRQWDTFVSALPAEDRTGNLATAFNRLLMSDDPDVHGPAAKAWCRWEDVHVSIVNGFQPQLSVQELPFQLCFARLVTHYWGNAAFLPDGMLIQQAHKLAGTPTFITHGRRDISGPADIAVAVAEAIPNSELFIAETEGHGGPTMTAWTIEVTNRLAGA